MVGVYTGENPLRSQEVVERQEEARDWQLTSRAHLRWLKDIWRFHPFPIASPWRPNLETQIFKGTNLSRPQSCNCLILNILSHSNTRSQQYNHEAGVPSHRMLSQGQRTCMPRHLGQMKKSLGSWVQLPGFQSWFCYWVCFCRSFTK